MPNAQTLILGAAGYIGSALAQYLAAEGVPATLLDCRVTSGSSASIQQRYQELEASELAKYDVVVLLAGHSSVAACAANPSAAFQNNVAGFVDLLHKLRTQKLIFASSISVYGSRSGLAREDDPFADAYCAYDHHKQSIERYAALAYPNHYALRFGTVCGPSPAIRSELLLNNLVRSALHEQFVRVANRSVSRPLLGLNDLVRAIRVLIEHQIPPGRYNLASKNVQIGEVADYVATALRVPCLESTQATGYDVAVDTTKFCTAAGFTFRDTLATLVEELRSYFTAPKHLSTIT